MHSPPGDLASAAAGVQAAVEAREAGAHPSEAALLLHLATLRARFPLLPVAESATTAILGFGTRLAQTPNIWNCIYEQDHSKQAPKIEPIEYMSSADLVNMLHLEGPYA